EFYVVPKCAQIFSQHRGVAFGAQPTAHTFFSNGGGKSFVEIRVATDEDTLMGQFVEQDLCQFGFVVVDERVKQGVLKPAERRVSFNAIYGDIKSPPVE